MFLIQSAGIEEQPVAKKFIRIKRPIEVREHDRNGDKWARFEPYDGFRLTFSIVFNHPAIDRTGQEVTIDFAENSYAAKWLVPEHSVLCKRSSGCVKMVWLKAVGWIMP